MDWKEMGKNENDTELEDFQPKGALAFFVLLMVMFTIMWFVMYFELLSRG